MVQVHKESMRQHIITMHPYTSSSSSSSSTSSSAPIRNYYVRVQLVPDLTALTQRISDSCPRDKRTLYKCGIGACNVICANQTAFEVHLSTTHRRDMSRFQCWHCSKSIEKWTVDTVVQHMLRHSHIIFKCTVCKDLFERHQDIVDHMKSDHRRVFSQKCWIYQNCRMRFGTFCAQHELVIKCRTCNVHLASMADANGHVADVHRSRNVALSLIEWIKETTLNGLTKHRMAEMPLAVKQDFHCKRCNSHEAMSSKADLLTHYQRNHVMESMAIDLTETWLMNDDSQTTSIERNTLFVCAHCYRANATLAYYYATAHDVHTHWQRFHGKSMEPKPFQFYTTELMACFHCNAISTFDGLRKHHNEKHAAEPFVIRSNAGANSVEISRIRKNFNPKPFSKELLSHLQSIDVNAKYQCLRCKQFFDTEQSYNEHQVAQHPTQIRQFVRVLDNELDYCIAACCSKCIQPMDMIEHLQMSPHCFECSGCAFKTSDIFEMATHRTKQHGIDTNQRKFLTAFVRNVFWRTEFVFRNGLVVNKNNLFLSTFFDWEQYEKFIQWKLQKV